MSARRRTHNELRCFCARNPLLATYGLDEQSKVYIHVKIYKQGRIFGELVITGGAVKILCRECLRWHRIVIKSVGKAELVEVSDQNPSLQEV